MIAGKKRSVKTKSAGKHLWGGIRFKSVGVREESPPASKSNSEEG
jgi:hypothetical protein